MNGSDVLNRALAASVQGSRSTPETERINRQERLNTAMADYEGAMKRGDDEAAAFADHRIDALLDESRGERAASRGAEQPRDESGRFAGFDGGVRGRHSRPNPGMGGETSTELMLRAFSARRSERVDEHTFHPDI